jgi:hypothetical protein
MALAPIKAPRAAVGKPCPVLVVPPSWITFSTNQVIIANSTGVTGKPPVAVTYFMPPKPILLHLGNNTDFDFGKHNPQAWVSGSGTAHA